MRIAGSRVWVVGASSGIGAEVARQLVAAGASVAISARNTAALEQVSGGAMHVKRLDVTDAAQAIVAASAVTHALGGLDAVVLSAGHWEQGTAGTLDAQDFAAHLQTNLIGAANVIAAVLPGMRENGSGLIVGIASVAGFRGLPGGEGYGASKAGLINLLEALRAGLRGTGVRVQTICPGFVTTPLTSKNDFSMPFLIDAEQAGRTILAALASERPLVVFPWPMAVLARAARLVPAGLWARLVAPRSSPRKSSPRGSSPRGSSSRGTSRPSSPTRS